MRSTLISLVFAFVVGLFAADADAARRFGGGGNLGKQRATPMQRDATPAQTPAQQAAPAPAAAGAGAAAAAKPTFMQRWGGLLAGLGIGMLLTSLFGAQLGPIIGMLLLGLLIAAVAFMLYRLFAGGARRAPALSPSGAPGNSPAFSGIGSRAGGPVSNEFRGSANVAGARTEPVEAAGTQIPNFDREAFLRVAKTSFIRLQAANDAKDLDDIRDYTTPEMYAEIAMQVKERGDEPQRTEVVSLSAEMVEAVVEGDYEIASVRFYGLIRENESANPEPFDEVWHVRKDRRDRRGAWVIAGIQQRD